MKVQIQPNKINNLNDITGFTGEGLYHIEYFSGLTEGETLFISVSDIEPASVNSVNADTFIRCETESIRSTKSIYVESGQSLYCWLTDTNSSNGNLIVTKAKVDAGSANSTPDGAYRGERALTVQGYIEANVKTGRQFSASSYYTSLTSGEVLDTIVQTGSLPVIIKAQYTAIENGGDVLIEWFENPDFTGGADLNSGIFNQTEINPSVTTVQLTGVAPIGGGDYSVDDATKPTINDVGTPIQPLIAVLGTEGQGNSVTSRNAEIGLEHVLAPNSTYLFRRTLTAATDAIFGYSTWFEGFPDLPKD